MANKQLIMTQEFLELLKLIIKKLMENSNFKI